MGVGGWEMRDGSGKMGDGRLELEDGRWKVGDFIKSRILVKMK
jgi:hypothetical protein